MSTVIPHIPYSIGARTRMNWELYDRYLKARDQMDTTHGPALTEHQRYALDEMNSHNPEEDYSHDDI